MNDPFAIMLGSQRFTYAGEVSGKRRDGSPLALMAWETNCPDCGSPFRITTTRVFQNPRRRCDQCRAPGKPV